ncbi:MAG TPA: glucuronate isomerase [Bacillota bacterium]|nr:glucuronate isomerase [Clostridiales bacterium]HPT84769.1 glucuronate isomerase [Bacillota bacterium]
MKKFLGKNFLLYSDAARDLYHNYAAKLPIIDYHCHLNPREIAEDRRFSNITELWIGNPKDGGDHYKWRAMRSCGIPEKYITGDASDYEKFRAYATAMPKLAGNPLYHWSHLELRRYFGWEGVLSPETCDEVWELAAEKLAEPEFSARGIIARSNVELICTTDDPADTLEYHDKLAEAYRNGEFKTRVLPAFRPDKAVNCEREGYAAYIERLSAASGVKIDCFDTLCEALSKRMDFFAARGCKVSDHGMDTAVPFALAANKKQLDDTFSAALEGKPLTDEQVAAFKTALYCFLASEYRRRGWVMQIHYGVLRNVNPVFWKSLGPDCGCDVICGRPSTYELAMLLGKIAAESGLPRTIIYSINPADNAAVAALIGAFQQSEDGIPLVYQGSAWWFCDHKQGMREQMITLANLSAIGCFPGMLTDSRSFVSYTRHEYFRRILCDLVGEWVENGELPADLDLAAQLVMDVCYNNIKRILGV